MLVTLELAKQDRVVTDDEQDDFIVQKIIQASGIILDFLELPETSYQSTNGDPESVPPHIETAVLLCLGALMENREGNPNGPQPLSQAVRDVLHRARRKVMA